jgi:hypothetical protein
MSTSFVSTEHRARELLNLVHLSDRCARLPDIHDAERRRWQFETHQAWDELQTLLPHLSPRDRAAQELTLLATRIALELDLHGMPARLRQKEGMANQG